MNRPQPQVCSGLILAGGRGERLDGADKGWLQLDGRPLIERVIDQLRPQIRDLIVSANRNVDRYRQLGYPVVTDAENEYAGPLAGILAGLTHMQTEWLITVPVDAPRLPPGYVQRMCDASDTASLRVAHDGKRLQPVYCLLHRDLKPALEQALASGIRAPVRWQEQMGALAVSFADAADCFANVNTAEQLAQFKG